MVVFRSNKVSGLIREYGMTQEDFAKKMGFSLTTAKNKLSNKNPFNADEITRMAEMFKVNPAIFFAKEVSKKEIGK